MKLWKKATALSLSFLMLIFCLPSVIAESTPNVAAVIQEEEISKTGGNNQSLNQDFKFTEFKMTKGNDNYLLQGQVKLTLSADATAIPQEQIVTAVDAALNGDIIMARYAGVANDWGRYGKLKDYIDSAAKGFDIWMTFTFPMNKYGFDTVGEFKPDITNYISKSITGFSGSVTCTFKQVYLLDISDARIVARFNDKSATTGKKGDIKFAWQKDAMVPFTNGIENYTIEGKIKLTLPDGVICSPENTEDWVKKALCRDGGAASLIFTQDKVSNTWGWIGTLDTHITSDYAFNDWMAFSIPMTICQKNGVPYTGLQEWKFEAKNNIPYEGDGSLTCEMTDLQLVDHSVNADGTPALPSLTVSFMGKFDQTIHTAVVTSAEELDALLTSLKAPTLGGYTFCGWDAAEADIIFDSYKGQETPYIIHAVYSVGDNAGKRKKYPLTIAPDIQISSEISEDGQYYFDQRISLTATGDVAYWELDGQKLNYGNNSFTFYVTGENHIRVIMDDGTPIVPEASVSIQQTAYSSTMVNDSYNYTLTVIAQTYLPVGSGEVTEFGVYYAATADALEGIKNGQSATYLKVESTKTGKNQQYMTHLLDVKPEKTRYAMAYMVVNERTTYSGMVSFATGIDGTVIIE